MPVTAKNMHNALKVLPSIQANIDELLTPFCSVFRENSNRTRFKFFQNGLVQRMWTRYCVIERRRIVNYFHDMAVRQGQNDVEALLRDIVLLQNRLNITVLDFDLLKACTPASSTSTQLLHH